MIPKSLQSLDISASSSLPGHLQLAQQIEALIRKGKLKDGERLPPTATLVKLWRRNVSQIQRAMEILTFQGLLQRFPRRGTFVVGQSSPQAIGILNSSDLLLEQSHFFRILSASLAEEISQQGADPRFYGALAFPESDAEHNARKALSYDLRHRHFAGFIVVGNADLVEYLAPAGNRPIVTYGASAVLDPVTPPGVLDVSIDYGDFASQSIRWLVTSGCRRVAVIPQAPPTRFNGHSLVEKLYAEATAMGASTPGGAVVDLRSNTPRNYPCGLDRAAYEGTRLALEEWHRSGFFPDGIVVTDDIATRGVTAAVQAALSTRRALPKIVTMTTREIQHFYTLPVARYTIPVREIAARIMARLAAKAAGIPIANGTELIRGEMLEDFR